MRLLWIITSIVIGWFLVVAVDVSGVVTSAEFASKAYTFISIFVFFGGYGAYLRTRYDSLSGLTGLRALEQERLQSIVEQRQRKIFIYIVFYILAILYFAGLGMFSGSPNILFYLKLGGVTIGLGFYSFIDMYLAVKEVTNFKWDLDKKQEKEKQKKVLLDKINSSSEQHTLNGSS